MGREKHLILMDRHCMLECLGLLIQERGEYLEFEAPLPEDFEHLLDQLRK